eukprot:759087-Hanusia_phi.AAC.1
MVLKSSHWKVLKQYPGGFTLGPVQEEVDNEYLRAASQTLLVEVQSMKQRKPPRISLRMEEKNVGDDGIKSVLNALQEVS